MLIGCGLAADLLWLCICQKSSEHSLAYEAQLPEIATISQRMTVTDGLSQKRSRGFMSRLTTRAAHHDLPAHTPHAATLFIFIYALGFSSHALASRLVIQNS